jgi:hypothetical protein
MKLRLMILLFPPRLKKGLRRNETRIRSSFVLILLFAQGSVLRPRECADREKGRREHLVGFKEV